MGANLRRIEAVTSFDAYEYATREEDELLLTAATFKVPRFDVNERAAAAVKRLKELEAGANRIVDVVADDEISRMLGEAVDAGYTLVVAQAPEVRPAALRSLWDVLRSARSTLS